jgi:hypothetical protein
MRNNEITVMPKRMNGKLNSAVGKRSAYRHGRDIGRHGSNHPVSDDAPRLQILSPQMTMESGTTAYGDEHS